jgi:hypothetical protein
MTNIAWSCPSVINPNFECLPVIFTGGTNSVIIVLKASSAGTFSAGSAAYPPAPQVLVLNFSQLADNLSTLALTVTDYASDTGYAATWHDSYGDNFPNGAWVVSSPTASVDFQAGDWLSITVSGITPTATTGMATIVLTPWQSTSGGAALPASLFIGTQINKNDDLLSQFVSFGFLNASDIVDVSKNTVTTHAYPAPTELSPTPETLNNVIGFALTSGDSTGFKSTSGARIIVLLCTTSSSTSSPGYLGSYAMVESAQLSVTSPTGVWTSNQVTEYGMPYWTLTCAAGAEGLFAETAPLNVAISGINTQFAPGPTPIVLFVTGIDGYNPSCFSAQLTKQYASVTQVQALESTASTVVGGFSAVAPTTSLSWQFANATAVELHGFGLVPAYSGNYSQGKVLPATLPSLPVNRSKTFVVLAFDSVCGTVTGSQVTVPANPTLASSIMPHGSIIPWYGSYSDIPDGWVPCDGSTAAATAQAPDLSDLFIVGAGGSFKPGDTHSALNHIHSVTFDSTQPTSDAGAHSHNGTSVKSDWVIALAHTYRAHFLGINTTDAVLSTQTFGKHVDHHHSLKISQKEKTVSVSGAIRPPYYCLYFIMKL